MEKKNNMKKVVENIWIKTIISLIVVAIMGVIIIFVYNYYNDLAISGNKEEINEVDEIDEKDNKKENTENYQFERFNLSRTRVFLKDKAFILNIIDTDGGKVVALDGLALLDYNQDYEISYMIYDDIFILKYNKNDKHGNNYIFVNKKLEILQTFSEIKENKYSYILSNILFDDYKNDFEINNGKIYLTYVMYNIDNEIIFNDLTLLKEIKEKDYNKYGINDNTNIQFTYEITYNNNLEYNIISTHTLATYLKK